MCYRRVRGGVEYQKWEWFPSEELVEFQGEQTTRKQHEKDTPGKFKEEYYGDGMLCANSKTYIRWSRNDKRAEVIFDIKLSS